MKFGCAIKTVLLCALGLLAASLPARELPPLVPPPQPVVIPVPAAQTLPNGLTVLVLERHTLPVVTLNLAIKAGAEADPPGLPGAAQLVASLLDEGTEDRGAQQIAEAIDDAGGSIDVGAEWDDSYASLSVLSDHTQLAFNLLSDMAIHPAFSAEEVKRIRKQTLSALDILRHDPGYLADTLFERMVFWGTPYSHPANGVEESIRRITSRDLRRFHDTYYRPSNAALVVVGDIASSQAFALARQFFGGWKASPRSPAVKVLPNRRGSPPASANHPNGQAARQVVVIDDPAAVQTEIRIGNTAIRRASPDYAALTVANQVLGGPAVNLLFSVLRSRHGLVYGASSDIVSYRNGGAWEAKTSTRTAQTSKAVELILDQMKNLRDRSLSSMDLSMAQDYLIGHMALDFESSQEVAQQLLELLVYNLPLDYWSHFPGEVRGLTRDEVRMATRRYLDPQHSVIVLVGNAQDFKDNLKSLGNVRIIPMANVDLASATLERPETQIATTDSTRHK
ncbi:MAG TPA: pitrilysin family protein [Terriglobia bacterium]|nr:pitrilysin family protein [Terriglobia bacterium]